MKELDKFANHLLDQVIMLTIKANFTPEYVEGMPRMQRVHAIKTVEKMIEAEEKALSKKEKMTF